MREKNSAVAPRPATAKLDIKPNGEATLRFEGLSARIDNPDGSPSRYERISLTARLRCVNPGPP